MHRLKATIFGLAILLVAPHGANAQSQFVVRPYLMDVSDHGIAVLFTLAHASAVTVRVSAVGHETRTVASGAQSRHEITIDGLDADTRYNYDVLAENELLARGSFGTAPTDTRASVRFLLYGDTRTNPATHASVIRAMERISADFVVHTGDFVPDGRRAEQWTKFFDAAAPLLASTPLVPAIGNHEFVSGEGLPSYEANMRIPRDGSPNETFFLFRYGPLRILSLNSSESMEPGSPQRSWLEQTLNELDAEPDHVRRMVLLHHGPYSSGAHGSNDAIAGTDVEELFRRHRVEFVMAGHDHIYERGDVSGLKYIVSGGGGAPIYFTNRGLPSQLAFSPVHHFVRVDVTPERMEIAAIGADGRTFDACSTRGLSDPWHCGRSGSRGVVSRETTSGLGRTTIVLGLVLVLAVALLARRRRNAATKRS